MVCGGAWNVGHAKKNGTEDDFALHSFANMSFYRFYLAQLPISFMGNLKKKRRLKMNKHKRRKRSHDNRHKKRVV